VIDAEQDSFRMRSQQLKAMIWCIAFPSLLHVALDLLITAVVRPGAVHASVAIAFQGVLP